jgi:hypothetical protein
LVHVGIEALDLAGPVDRLLDHRSGWHPRSRHRRVGSAR